MYVCAASFMYTDLSVCAEYLLAECVQMAECIWMWYVHCVYLETSVCLLWPVWTCVGDERPWACVLAFKSWSYWVREICLKAVHARGDKQKAHAASVVGGGMRRVCVCVGGVVRQGAKVSTAKEGQMNWLLMTTPETNQSDWCIFHCLSFQCLKLRENLGEWPAVNAHLNRGDILFS